MRKAAFSPSQSVDIQSAVGRVCALTVTGCQPSVPVTVSGEVISEYSVKLLEACGIRKINVI
jgi:arginine/lysine/ornithine decarboxylase